MRCKLSLCVKDTCSCLCMRRMLSLRANDTLLSIRYGYVYETHMLSTRCVHVYEMIKEVLCMRRIISLCVKDTLLSIRYGYVYETHMLSIRYVHVYEMIKEVLCCRYKTFKCE